MVSQINTIIIGFGHFGLVWEPTGTFIFIKYRFAGDGHDGKLSVVVNPWTGLMCLLESAKFVGCINISPSISHLTCLRHPEVHAPWQGDGRIGITCWEGNLGQGTHQRVHIVYGVQFVKCTCIHGSNQCECRQTRFNDVHIIYLVSVISMANLQQKTGTGKCVIIYSLLRWMCSTKTMNCLSVIEYNQLAIVLDVSILHLSRFYKTCPAWSDLISLFVRSGT